MNDTLSAAALRRLAADKGEQSAARDAEPVVLSAGNLRGPSMPSSWRMRNSGTHSPVPLPY
jgi:hypothetical protein